jgi:hypothetical protein
MPKVKQLKYGLQPLSRSCELVTLPSSNIRYPNPIGRICRSRDGYMYSFLGDRGEVPYRGPTRIKAAAVAEVISHYASWIGGPAREPKVLKRKRRRR